MLCRTALEHAAEVARNWVVRDYPVVIHVDKRVKPAVYHGLAKSLSGLGNVRFSGGYAGEWGTWRSLAATLEASTIMLATFCNVRHVYLSSGPRLPLRPAGKMVAYLDNRPRADFIKSVMTEDVSWTICGQNLERFTLLFPFNWRKQQYMFDWYVNFQRCVKFRRKVPPAFVLHRGSQWWCLTRQTLSAILKSPDREEIDRYLKRVWISDESYFQTMLLQFSTNFESRSLTLSKFDYQGKPCIFYDDHLQFLRRSVCFVARKISPQSQKL